ncbi:hypothetical protein [Solitalea lacus]|uniref:hypothetical protein n=1 Tax=Solitalea lacus TaxID=2911172 RepID=UPI001EDB8685|nr:hypothetical protein [Solitalea lacus]UKJ08520.1 hypothetical protein L2B55_04990 [Solitalea lacus]
MKCKHSVIMVFITAIMLTGCGKDEPITNQQDAELTENSELSKAVECVMNGIPSFPGASKFVDNITNPYFPLIPKTIYKYKSVTDEGTEIDIVEVTTKTKPILGVTARVIHDRAFLDGELIEDTFDYYAQDKQGNVWYFGEDTKELENGQVVSTEGTWRAGINGATPGIIMLAEPKIGLKYQQEFAEDVAEDRAKVLSLSETVEVPFGNFNNCLKTLDTTPLDPSIREFKFYAPGVGSVLEVQGKERLELISLTIKK